MTIATTSQERLEVLYDLLLACGKGEYPSEKIADLATVAEIQQVVAICEDLAMERLADQLYETNPCVFQVDTLIH